MFTIRSLNTKAKSDGRETHAWQKSHKTSIETVEARTVLFHPKTSGFGLLCSFYRPVTGHSSSTCRGLWVVWVRMSMCRITYLVGVCETQNLGGPQHRLLPLPLLTGRVLLVIVPSCWHILIGVLGHSGPHEKGAKPGLGDC